MPEDKTLIERIAIVETILTDIKDNHLSHIYKRLNRLPNWATAIITILSSICTGLIVAKFN